MARGADKHTTSGETTKIPRSKDVDTYIEAAQPEAREKLLQLRAIVKATAPKAEESLSYKMPYYKYYGALVGFAAYKNHIGFFGALPAEYEDELRAYDTGKGTIRFPINKPLPIALIKKILRARMRENETSRK